MSINSPGVSNNCVRINHQRCTHIGYQSIPNTQLIHTCVVILYTFLLRTSMTMVTSVLAFDISSRLQNHDPLVYVHLCQTSIMDSQDQKISRAPSLGAVPAL